MISNILKRFKNSPDREHEMSFNRLIFLSVIVAYTFWINPSVPRQALVSAAVFAVISIGIVAHILLRPQQSTLRRIIAIASDLGTASFQLHYVGETSSVLFLLYLWVTFGNGFRFGVRFLYIAMAVSVACFIAVIYSTPRWQEDIYLSASLLLSLIVLPLYASTLIRKLSNAKAQAEAANRSKTLFLASVSHELRTPLNAIIGLSSLIRETKLDAEQRGIIRTINSAGEALLRQINSILSLSRIEAGQMPIQNDDFDLLELLSTTRAMINTQAQQKGLKLTIHVAPWTPAKLNGAKHQLEEILLNLLGNAVKFTDKGHVTLIAHPVMQGDVTFIRFVVSDTGIGIAPQSIGRIFESFTQADETIINRYGGTGLGLSICRQLITTIGGEIGVDSHEGHGSSFWFTLPVSVVAQSELPLALPDLFSPLLICSDADAAHNIVSRLAGSRETPIFGDLAGARQWIEQKNSIEWLPFYYTDLPEGVVADEIVKAGLPVNPVLVQPEPTRMLATLKLARFTTSVLPFDFTLSEARIASVAMAAQTTLAQSLWSEPNRSQLPVSSRSLSVLVADDNATNRMVISKILERGGHLPQCVTNGEEALNALELGEFDLVIMDINMPIMTGIEATELFRFTEPSGTHKPIIALTADATPEVVARTLQAGMDACLTKPVQPATLLRLIEDTVSADMDDASVTSGARMPPAANDRMPCIDESLLVELEQLGGRDFISDLVEEFYSDANHLIQELRDAATSADSHRFRLEAHGLQSASANVGARTVHEICIGWRKITSADLARDGTEQVDHLAHELSRTYNMLRDYLERNSRKIGTSALVQ